MLIHILQFVQVVLGVILLIRIGGILLRKINVIAGIWNIYIFVIATILSSFYMHSIITTVLFILNIINFILNEVYRKMLYNKYKISVSDILEAASVVFLIAVYIYCSM